MATVAVDAPFDWPGMLGYFATRAIRGVEHVAEGSYRRVGDAGAIALRLEDQTLLLRTSGRAPARQVRRLLGLDADHQGALAVLGADPIIGPRVRHNAGMRVPGTWDAFETGVRAIVGQQVSVAGASTVTARVVARHGTPVARLGIGLTHRFPRPDVLAEADLHGLGLTGQRIAAIRGFAAAVAGGDIVLDRSVPQEELVASITAVRGLGPWTAHYLAIRIGHPDAFPVADLGLQRAAMLDAKGLAAAAERWRPHRALAAVHLWETPPSG